MASFSIDDVRETLTADVTQFLTRIEETAGKLTDTSGADPARFLDIEEAGHAIYGTTALVSALSLAHSAKLLEALASRGKAELVHAQAHAERARSIAELVRAGAGEMRTMLDLELDHRGDDAQWVALAWQEQAQTLLRAATAVADAAKASLAPLAVEEVPAEEIQLDDDDLIEIDAGDPGDAVAEDGASFAFEAPAADDAVSAELREIFLQEARECLVALQGHLEALFADPADVAAARALERLYHTLRGAAATVGLLEASDRAHALQERLQAVVECGESVTEALLDLLVADTMALLATAGLPHVNFAVRRARPASPRPVADEALADFVVELRAAFDEASLRLEEFGSDDGTLAGDARDALGRIFHRIKGSALVVGEAAIAEQAARLQEACDGVPDTAELARGLARIGALAGVPGVHDANGPLGAHAALGPTPARSSSSSMNVDDEARATFHAEARQICDDAGALLDRLQTTTLTSNGADFVDELGRLFHRLKGSALVVGNSAVYEHAVQLEGAAKGDATGAARTEEIRRGLALVMRRLGASSAAASVALRSDDAAERCVVERAEPELWEAFTQECAELLESLDRQVLTLEDTDKPRDALRAILLPIHTLKGVVNTMGLVPTGKVLHGVEDFLEGLIDAAVLPALRSVASFLLEVQAAVRRSLKQASKGYVELSVGKFQAHIARVLRGPQPKSASSGMHDSSAHGSALSQGSEHDAESAVGVERRFVRVDTRRLDELMNLAGELVVSRSRLLSRVQTLRLVQTELGRGSRRLIETVEKFCTEHEFAQLDGGTRTLALAAGAESLSTTPRARVAANDGAWSSFGELELDRYEDIHILSRSLTELTSDFGAMYGQLTHNLTSLTGDADAFSGIVIGIQSEVTRSRMVPLEVLFSRLRLPIRDAAIGDAKEVRVVTRGEDVQLDKTIADALFQPMLHLVRNAVAHGLERPELREPNGKPTSGVIELMAREDLGQIVIEVRDDGHGLDLTKLRARGIAMGLISPDVTESDPAVAELVFAPGLSTEAVARAVAGRGVGCDIVRRAVERLNGTIHVKTEAGRFTSFVLTLPLTLAITKALVVQQGGQPFAIPLYFTERILDVVEQEVVDSVGLRRVRLDDQWVPVQSLGRLLGQEGANERGPIVVMRVGADRVLMQVDSVVVQEEIVVKSLGAVLTGHPLFAGATVRGTGEMALILDVPGLVESRARRAVSPERRAAARPIPAELSDGEGPARVEEAPASGPRMSSPPVAATPQAGRSGRLRIMFVDDSLSVRKVAERALEALDVDVTTAVDGLDALEKMRTETFDLVFTDLEMPRMHGFELIRELRFIKAHKELPIVVVTSRSGQKHQEQARALGANEYLTKPFTQQSLAAAIEKWARGRRSGATS